jgi:AcrR family transcriptional regulator
MMLFDLPTRRAVPKRPPPRPPDLRRAVLDASLALVEEGGVGALSMREVARRANVTHGAPYHHFADRAAILADLAAEGFALLSQEMTAGMKKEPPGTLARFEACGLAYFRFAVRHPAYMRIMFRPELAKPSDHPAIDVAAAGAMRVLVECITACQESGVMPGGDATPIALTSWAAIHGLATLWLDGPLCRLHHWKGPPEALARTVARTLSDLLHASVEKSA